MKCSDIGFPLRATGPCLESWQQFWFWRVRRTAGVTSKATWISNSTDFGEGSRVLLVYSWLTPSLAARKLWQMDSQTVGLFVRNRQANSHAGFPRSWTASSSPSILHLRFGSQSLRATAQISFARRHTGTKLSTTSQVSHSRAKQSSAPDAPALWHIPHVLADYHISG